MKRPIILSLVLLLALVAIPGLAEEKKEKIKTKKVDEKTIEVNITNIPDGHISLFVPLMIDTSVVDLSSVVLGDLSDKEILGVVANSMSKSTPGVGLVILKQGESLPKELKFRVNLKKIGNGTSDIALEEITSEPALLTKGVSFRNDLAVSTGEGSSVEVSQVEKNGKKKLKISNSKLQINVKRPAQVADTFFVPILVDEKIVDLDETFGHSIIAPGITAKTFGSGSLHNGGSGVEVVLTEEADKDFSFEIDLRAKGVGNTEILAAKPQKAQVALVRGAIVEINPSMVTVANK